MVNIFPLHLIPGFSERLFERQDFLYSYSPTFPPTPQPDGKMVRWQRFSAGNQATWLWPLSSLTFMWNEWLEGSYFWYQLWEGESLGLASELWIISSPLTNEGTLWWSVSFTEYHCPALCEGTGSNSLQLAVVGAHPCLETEVEDEGFCKPVVHDRFVKGLQTIRMWPLLPTTCIPTRGAPAQREGEGQESVLLPIGRPTQVLIASCQGRSRPQGLWPFLCPSIWAQEIGPDSTLAGKVWGGGEKSQGKTDPDPMSRAGQRCLFIF